MQSPTISGNPALRRANIQVSRVRQANVNFRIWKRAMNTESASTNMRAQVVGLARKIGFDLCRFARAETPEHATEFRDWLDRGDAGEMNYLARNSERRCDPRQILPDVKTVIVLALNYFQGAHKADSAAAGVPAAKGAAGTAASTGRIARYA